MPGTLPPFSPPSLASTLAFIAVVAFVCAAIVAAVAHALQSRRGALIAAGALSIWLAISAVLAESGFFEALAKRDLVLVYVLASLGLATGLAASPLGGRIARATPLHALIGFQVFRLPLELVLHSWYQQGSLPRQMTYSGDNWDIVTGAVSLVAALLLRVGFATPRVRRGIAWGAQLIGFVLLLRVMNIALRSTPGPLRTYLDDPPILLAFHAPYTWILPICVAGAFAGHLICFRRLRAEGRAASA
jgi:hypothetical protein